MFRGLMDSKRHPDPRVRKHPGLFTDEAVRNYLGGNLARLILGACERLLASGQGQTAGLS
jgi:hypothetical protein